MRAITDKIEVNVPVEDLFNTLIKPSEIAQWWKAKSVIVLPQKNGIWVGTWGDSIDNPDYIVSARILRFEPPSTMLLGNYQYYSKDGELPFEADIQTEFVVEPTAVGARLTVTQTGFPDSSDADEYVQGCEAGWRTTLEGIETLFCD